MTDREFCDVLRIRAQTICRDASRSLDASQTSDGMMAPHVALERITKLHQVARQLKAMADLAETFQR